MTLSASLFDEEKEIVSSKKFDNNILTFNELSSNSKYILQINHKDDLIYEKFFYTLNSPLIKLDEYFSDDQNLYFVLLHDYLLIMSRLVKLFYKTLSKYFAITFCFH